VLKLYGEGVYVSSITLKGNNGEKLAGRATVTMPLDGVPMVTMASDAADMITLTCSEPVQLGATEEEVIQFWFVVPPVTFSSGFTITVNDISGVSSKKSTSNSISINRNRLSKMSAIEVELPISIQDAVDLGLPSGIKWSLCNLGASSPEASGDYYAWGETEPYYQISHSQDNPCNNWNEGKEQGYVWWSYKWCMGSAKSLLKYCNKDSYGHRSFVDGKTVLEPEDDAAYVKLGGGWRMPAIRDWSELYYYCDITQATKDGVEGWLLTSTINGNSIFLPFAGNRSYTELYPGYLGLYWSTSINTKDPSTAVAQRISNTGGYSQNYDRCEGLTIRPVYDEGIHPESVTLNKSSMSLTIGATEQLKATILPTDVTNNTVSWSSNYPDIASVDNSGNVTALTAGITSITVTTNDGRLSATCEVTVFAIPSAVDLGLPSGRKWASFNLGATKPEECGYYYAWGETEKKKDYSWSTYKWCMGTNNTLTKYCFSSEYGYNGFTDSKTTMDLEDDAAYVILGEKWRMPTGDDWSELASNCQLLDTVQNRVDGILITSNINGNSIFLPSSGYMEGSKLYRWDYSSEHNGWLPTLDEYFPQQAWNITVTDSGIGGYCPPRCIGYAIRPVLSE
jgi:uncharacterized protein YjdB